MKPSTLVPLLTVGGLLLINVAWAGPERLTNARVLVSEVKDTRTTGSFFGKCEVELKIMGRWIGKSLGIRGVEVTYAVDNQGTLLVPDKKKQTSTFFNRNKDNSLTLKHDLDLKNPARSSTHIQILRGKVELFMPSESNGGKSLAGAIMKQPGKALATDAMKKHGVSVTYMTPELYKKKQKEEMEKAKKKAGKEMGKLGEQMGEAFMTMFGGMMGGMMGDDKNSVRLVVEDPDDKVVDIEFQDGAGNRLDTTTRSSMGGLRTYGFKTLPGPDTQLMVYLAVPDAIKTVPFELKDIALP